MPAQFDLFAQPIPPATSGQLSLFAEDAEVEVSEAGSPAGKKPRKRGAKTRGALVREGGTPFTISLFDGDDAAEVVETVAEPAKPPTALASASITPPPPSLPPPARTMRAARVATPALPPLTLPFGDDEDTQETGEPSYRVLFDSTVWALRPDSGDFIHVGTGEIRDEESFTFPNDPRADYADLLDEWDVPQVRPYR